MHPAFRDGFEKTASTGIMQGLGHVAKAGLRGLGKAVTNPVTHPINTMKGVKNTVKNTASGMFGGPVALGFTGLTAVGAGSQALEAATAPRGLTNVKL